MDLEIADYERTVKSLHEAVAERDAKIETLHEEIRCKEQQCASQQKLLGMPSAYCICTSISHLCCSTTVSTLLDHCCKVKGDECHAAPGRMWSAIESVMRLQCHTYGDFPICRHHCPCPMASAK